MSAVPWFFRSLKFTHGCGLSLFSFFRCACISKGNESGVHVVRADRQELVFILFQNNNRIAVPCITVLKQRDLKLLTSGKLLSLNEHAVC